MTEKCMSDFVKELFAKLHYEKIAIPFENERPLHELFYELKNETKRPAFFNKLRFDWDGRYPRSRELSEFLHAIHWNASGSVNNPSFEEISLLDKMAEMWNKQIEESELEFLKLAVEKAKNKFEQLKA
ncbi:MAG: hypothetical protein WC373_13375 [Smithella sp.]|jgi:hypothetical protein